MRKNTKLVDAIFNEYLPIFDLAIPFYWESSKFKHYAEWSNVDIDSIGEMHRIKINFKMHNSELELRETIAHELIHAWQFENDLEVDHGESFAKWCAWFKITHDLNTASNDCDAKEIFVHYCEMMKEAA